MNVVGLLYVAVVVGIMCLQSGMPATAFRVQNGRLRQYHYQSSVPRDLRLISTSNLNPDSIKM